MKQRRALIRQLVGVQIRNGCARAEESNRTLSFDAGGLTFDPWFYTDNDRIACWHEGLLGFYSLITCTRSVFKAVNFWVAGHQSLAVELWAPAIGLFYTAAFHALHAFLGMEGRVIFDSPTWTDASGDPIGPDPSLATYPQALIAVLKKDNTWNLEPRRRGHQLKWQELRQVFGSTDADIPDFLHVLFDELYGRQFRKGVNLKEVLLEPAKHRIRIGEVFEEFLTMIANSRHAALYEGIGVNPSLTEAIINEDHYPTRGETGKRARALAAFACALLTLSTQDIASQLAALKVTEKLQEKLAIRMFDPWADSPKTELLPAGDLRESLRTIEASIFRRAAIE